jgi:hypothetical protein
MVAQYARQKHLSPTTRHLFRKILKSWDLKDTISPSHTAFLPSILNIFPEKCPLSSIQETVNTNSNNGIP